MTKALAKGVRFARFGGANRVRLVVPLSPDLARRNAMRLHTPQWWAGRLRWTVVRARGALRNLRSEFDLDLDGSFGVELGEWLERVAGILGLRNMIPAFYLPPQSDRRRLSVLLMDGTGRPRAYAKLGWADGADSIRNEAEGLEWSGRLESDVIRTPRLIEHGQSDTFTYVLQDPIPLDFPSGLHGWCPAYARALSEIRRTGETRSPLADTGWWCGKDALDPEWRAVADMLEASEPDDGFELTAAHGDWVPWNVRHDGPRLWVYDWEGFSLHAPAMADRAHFELSVHFLVGRKSAARAADLAWSALEDGREAGGHTAEDILLAFLYLQLSGRTFDPAIWSRLGKPVARRYSRMVN